MYELCDGDGVGDMKLKKLIPLLDRLCCVQFPQVSKQEFSLDTDEIKPFIAQYGEKKVIRIGIKDAITYCVFLSLSPFEEDN